MSTTTYLDDIARTLSIAPAELAQGRQFNNVECPLCGMDKLSAINRNGKLLVKCHGPDGCDGVDILAELVPPPDATEYEFYAFRSAMSRGVWVLSMDVEIAGTYTAGALLSQCIYWWAEGETSPHRWHTTRVFRGEEFMVITDAEVMKATGMSASEVRTARKHLKERGLVCFETHLFKGETRTHVRPNLSAINAAYRDAS